MKKILLLTIAALTLTACGSQSTSDNYVDYAEPAPAPTQTQAASNYPEDEYLRDLHNFGGSRINNVTDDELIQMGYDICSLLDSGSTVSQLIYAVSINDVGDDEQNKAVLATIASAITNLCPEYRYQADQL